MGTDLNFESLEMGRIIDSRPDKITSALRLLYLTIGVGFFRSLMVISSQAQAYKTASEWFGIVSSTLFVFGIIWILIRLIGMGRNWARIIFLVMFLITFPYSLYQLFVGLSGYSLYKIIGFAQIVMQAVALILLFQRQSSDWYRQIKNVKGDGPQKLDNGVSSKSDRQRRICA